MIKINSWSVINIIIIYLKVSLFLILGDPISSAEVDFTLQVEYKKENYNQTAGADPHFSICQSLIFLVSVSKKCLHCRFEGCAHRVPTWETTLSCNTVHKLNFPYRVLFTTADIWKQFSKIIFLKTVLKHDPCYKNIAVSNSLLIRLKVVLLIL